MKKQKLVLIILFGVLALALVYSFLATPRQRRVTGPASSAGKRLAQKTPVPTPKEAEEAEAHRVRLELLDREPIKFRAPKRDIFRFPPVKKAPAVVKTPSPPPTPTSPLVDSPPPQPKPVVSSEVRRELARFRFLGFLLKGETKTVFLEEGKEIFVVKRGDRFGENKEFLVADLSGQTLTINRQGDERPIIIPLVEQAPLVPKQAGKTERAAPGNRKRENVPPPEPLPEPGMENGVEPETEGMPDQLPDGDVPPHPVPEDWENVSPEELESGTMPMEGR